MVSNVFRLLLANGFSQGLPKAGGHDRLRFKADLRLLDPFSLHPGGGRARKKRGMWKGVLLLDPDPVFALPCPHFIINWRPAILVDPLDAIIHGWWSRGVPCR